MDLLDSFLSLEMIKTLLSEAAQNELARTCGIFGFAALIHSKQVRKEIKAQFGLLVSVLREDLEAQKSVLGKLTDRVDNIESKLKLKGD